MLMTVNMYEENKACDVLARSLIVKTAGSDRGEACRKAHRRPTCAWGRTGAIHGVTNWELGPCERFLAMGSNEDYREA